jgi:hypothetical protein
MTADKRQYHPIRQQLTTIKVFLTGFDKANRNSPSPVLNIAVPWSM